MLRSKSAVLLWQVVCPSVRDVLWLHTLEYFEDYVTAISLRFSLFADPNVMDLIRILAGTGVEYGKKWLSAYKTRNIC